MNVNLHIERLVLDGVAIAPNQRHVLQSAVETELARLLTEDGVAPDIAVGGAIPSVTGNGIQIQRENGLGGLGRQIAGSVYGGIAKTRASTQTEK